MREVKIVLKEQLKNFRFIFRMSKYEESATYQSHYLGLLWQILNPLIQVGIYYLIFGLGLRGGRNVDGVPYIVWMLLGLIPWIYITQSFTGASRSIYRQVNLASKMKFPVSVLPTITIVSNLTNFFPMIVVVIVTLFAHGFMPTIYWLQFFYYLFCMIFFLFSFSIFNATIATVIRDYQIVLQSSMRLLFYISGTIWNFETANLPRWIVQILKLNPFFYITSGFRDSLMSREWFWDKMNYTLIFWFFTFIILIVGSHIHLKFRSKFVDYI